MKYLENDGLTRWTAALTDFTLYNSGSAGGGGSVIQAGLSRFHRHQSHERVLYGRIEAYTMKRTGSDKKYAHTLGTKYVAEIEHEENELARLQQQEVLKAITLVQPTQGRKRSQSAGTTLEALQSQSKPTKVPRRARAVSIDLGSTAASHSYMERVASSSDLVPRATSLGNFTESGTRRLMTDLILTLNASFPDYDFSNVRPDHFVKLTLAETMEVVNQRLSQWALQQPPASVNDMWKSMDAVVQLGDCQVYSYVPPPRDTEDDPLSFLAQTYVVNGVDEDDDNYDNGCESHSNVVPLWSFNYFFVNKSLKRIIFFSCIEVVRSCKANSSDDDEEDTMVYAHCADATASGDFDLDPASDVAGGIPVTTI